LAVTLNTDNPGLFHVSIADEYAAMWEASRTRVAGGEPKRENWLNTLPSVGESGFAQTIRNEPNVLAACEATLRHLGNMPSDHRAQTRPLANENEHSA